MEDFAYAWQHKRKKMTGSQFFTTLKRENIRIPVLYAGDDRSQSSGEHKNILFFQNIFSETVSMGFFANPGGPTITIVFQTDNFTSMNDNVERRSFR